MNQPKTSPTQLRCYQRCPRLYAYTYPGGERPPAGKGAELGSMLHEEFERALNKMRTADDPRVQVAIDQLTYEERTMSVLETWVEVDGTRGRVDLLHGNTVVDLKTMSSFAYAHTAETLAYDVQMVCYGLAVARHYGYDAVKLVHLQTVTKGPAECRRVEVEVTRAHLEEQWAKQRDTIDGIATLWQDYPELPEPLPDAPHAAPCRMYGGCHFASRCGARFPVPEEKPMIDQMRRAFDDLDEADQEAFVDLAGDTEFDQWPEHEQRQALDMLAAWNGAPSREETAAWIGLAPDVVRGLELGFHKSPMHPMHRGRVVTTVREWATELVGEHTTHADYAQALHEGAKPQPVLPPDAPENRALDPLDVPLTVIDGVGPTVAKRLEELGIKSVRDYVEAANPPMEAKGWSSAKHEAVWAYAMERADIVKAAPEPAQTTIKLLVDGKQLSDLHKLAAREMGMSRERLEEHMKREGETLDAAALDRMEAIRDAWKKNADAPTQESCRAHVRRLILATDDPAALRDLTLALYNLAMA